MDEIDVEDGEVLIECELAGADHRKWSNRAHIDLIGDAMRERTNALPPIIRDIALNAYASFVQLRDHFDDVLALLESEYSALKSDRVAMRAIDLNIYKHLPSKYRNNFARSRRYYQRRKARLACRIVRTREKIEYLTKRIVAHEGGVPETPLPCNLCLIGGTGTLVTPQEWPLCSNKQCTFVTCMKCYGKLRAESGAGVVPKCPGCRSHFRQRGAFIVCKHEGVDPFSILSEDDETEIEKEEEDDDEEIDL